MKLTATLLVSGFLVFATGCASSLDITHDFDPTFDFAGLQTYSWESGVIVGDVGQFTADRVRMIMNQVLTQKGFQEGLNPDFTIEMHGGRAEFHEAGWGWSGMEFNRIDKAGLILHMKNTRTGRTIWSGSVVGEPLQNPTVEQQTERLTEAINALLETFPPR